MNPLIIAGAASALSFAKDIFTSRTSNSQPTPAKAGEAAKNAASEFDKALETQTALNAQKAQAEREATLAKPLTPEAQTVALEAFNARQETIADRLQKGVAAGQITATQSQSVRALQVSAQAGLDTAMADGVLTVGEFRQVNASFDMASRQLSSYRFGQDAAQTPPGYQPVSMNV